MGPIPQEDRKLSRTTPRRTWPSSDIPYSATGRLPDGYDSSWYNLEQERRCIPWDSNAGEPFVEKYTEVLLKLGRMLKETEFEENFSKVSVGGDDKTYALELLRRAAQGEV